MDIKPAKKKSNDSDDLASRRSSRRRGPPKSPLDEDFVRPGQSQKTLGSNGNKKAKKEECSTETTPPSSGADPTVALLELAASVSQSPVKVCEGDDTVYEAHTPVSTDIQPCGVGDGQVDKDAAGDEDTVSKHPSNPSVSTGATDPSEVEVLSSCEQKSLEAVRIGKLKSCRLIDYASGEKRSQILASSCAAPSASSSLAMSKKRVWIWTENKQVMTAAVERGWNTFVFSSQCRALASEWSSMAMIYPLFIEKGELLNSDHRRVATFSEISSSEQLERLQPEDEQAEIVIVNLLDWQVIPAENIVAAFQSSQKTVFAISKTSTEAQIFLEALELGLGGVVLKVEDVKAVLELKDYFDRRNEASNILDLTKATVTQVQMAGMGDRVCVDLCSLLRPGEGLLVGSFARGLFLVHSECLESNYISSRPFRVNAGPVHAYVAVPGGKTCYLSELKAGKEVIVVDQNGSQRSAIVGRVKIETRPLILVEGKTDSDDPTAYSILLQNAETVPLVSAQRGNGYQSKAIPVTSLKVGDEVMLRIQGGARHTGIEIQEFIVEK
ncbi:hypothetical protein RHMOL_Rhmol08G0076600 [Rhododendron molle]|uniref:Uncharacterized protein n=2 Tax=Rhododendron molle TaxID=49168 RepID=A0ACC0MKW3_RHOML|nr:hypothetical protein RHMOL_Rhmol08G0076600 [Rhododendron molle]KAI8541628.1 hypothetical protein RHMOL_Rhmol08G0076600 [Rhododendron molle]